MSLQPSMWRALDVGYISLVPPDHVLRQMIATYEYNDERDYHQRRRLDEASPLALIEYTAHTSGMKIGAPIFTRNPRTGLVATHLSPYTDLPEFYVTSAHPSLMAVKAISCMVMGRTETTYPLIHRLFELSDYIDPVFAPPPRKLSRRSTTPPVAEAPSRKRKAVDNPAQPTKRQNVAPRLRTTRAKCTRRSTKDTVSSKMECAPAASSQRTYYPRSAKAVKAMSSKLHRRAG
ncbi:hypothetical protein CYLTODRAFT_426741 [Cylindrobasidium torrendii FP15055 ss-10]|uniref:Uncharacterized protein n=1 Tax=Cylindrobasidium torrendii FP15055 ss-10 TaxID=1314674 RepID=A0A0D7AXD6_9AGAR|nr:hypothetical protein CYLTODRAFT_426741 [Cylindrobasidium torrendii FP15055 ss-10]